MTDREHRIDTGSLEEKANPNQTREKAIERFNSWPKWKREAYTYRKPEGCTCLDNNRCFGCKPEDQMTASDHLKPSPRQTNCWSCGAPFNWLIHTVCPVCFAWPKRVIEQIAKERP